MFRAITLCSLAVACGAEETPPTTTETTEISTTTTSGRPGPDVTSPQVVAITPADGATAVREDAVVTITFSEPMDPESLLVAIDASDLGTVTHAWNAEGTVLTLTPEAPLPYAIGFGDDPSAVDALSYTVVMGTAAADLAGNTVENGVQVQFETAKVMSTVVQEDPVLTRSLTPEALRYDPADPLGVGDDSEDIGIRTVLTFDLSTLPTEAVHIVSAVIATRQLTGDVWGEPYTDLGTSVLVDHVTFAGLGNDNEINAAFNSNQEALGTLSGFCTQPDQVVVEFDVTPEVDDDLANRNLRLDRSQFLLRFETPTDLKADHDRAVFSRDLLELHVSYLAE